MKRIFTLTITTALLMCAEVADDHQLPLRELYWWKPGNGKNWKPGGINDDTPLNPGGLNVDKLRWNRVDYEMDEYKRIDDDEFIIKSKLGTIHFYKHRAKMWQGNLEIGKTTSYFRTMSDSWSDISLEFYVLKKK